MITQTNVPEINWEKALSAIEAAFEYLSQDERSALAAMAVLWANRQIAKRDGRAG